MSGISRRENDKDGGGRNATYHGGRRVENDVWNKWLKAESMNINRSAKNVTDVRKNDRRNSFNPRTGIPQGIRS
jgi:hypothetical protein